MKFKGAGFGLLIIFLLWSGSYFVACGPHISKKDARWARVFLDTAKSNLGNGNYFKAEMESKKSIDRNPQVAEAYRILALSYYMQNKMPAAMRNIKKAISLEPKSGYYHNDLGGFYLKTKRYGEALVQFQMALEDKNYREPAAALYNVARSYHLQGNIKMAVLKYQEAIARDPNQDRPLYWLGMIEKDRGNIDKAMSYFKDAIKINPLNIEAQTELCLNACSLKNDLNTKKYCSTALKLLNQVKRNDETVSEIKQCLYDVQ